MQVHFLNKKIRKQQQRLNRSIEEMRIYHSIKKKKLNYDIFVSN